MAASGMFKFMSADKFEEIATKILPVHEHQLNFLLETVKHLSTYFMSFWVLRTLEDCKGKDDELLDEFLLDLRTLVAKRDKNVCYEWVGEELPVKNNRKVNPMNEMRKKLWVAAGFSD